MFQPHSREIRHTCFFFIQWLSNKGGGGGKRLCARIAPHESETRCPLRAGSKALLRAMDAQGFRYTLMLSEPYFEAFSYTTGLKKKKPHSRSTFRWGVPVAPPLLGSAPAQRICVKMWPRIRQTMAIHCAVINKNNSIMLKSINQIKSNHHLIKIKAVWWSIAFYHLKQMHHDLWKNNWLSLAYLFMKY